MSRESPGPTIRRRMLGRELRRLREAVALTCDDVGKRLQWSGAKVSRIETARTAAHANDVRLLLDLYSLKSDEHREMLIDLTRMPRRSQGWWTDFPDVVPGKRWSFVKLEDDAEMIRNYEVEFIPGLLQTEAYARSCFKAACPTATSEAIDRQVAARMARQQLMGRDDAPELWLVLNDAALRRTAAMQASTARSQFEHLLAAAAKPNVTFQVLPFAVEPHPGQNGSFTLIQFPDPGGEVVHLDTLTGSLYLEEPQQLKSYDLAFQHLKAEALNEADSLKHVRDLIHQET